MNKVCTFIPLFLHVAGPRTTEPRGHALTYTSHAHALLGEKVCAYAS